MALRTVALARALARAGTVIARIATVTTIAAATTVRTTFTAGTVTVCVLLLTSAFFCASLACVFVDDDERRDREREDKRDRRGDAEDKEDN